MFKEILYSLGLINPLEGWLMPMVAAVLCIGLIVDASIKTGSFWLFCGNTSRKSYILFLTNFFFIYPLHGFIQQLITFSLWNGFTYFYTDWIWSTAVVAFLFAVAHRPNFFLMFPAGFLMYFALQHFQIHYNIYPLALAHGMVATCWERLTPKWILASTDTWLTHPGRYAAKQKRLNKIYKLQKRDYDKKLI